MDCLLSLKVKTNIKKKVNVNFECYISMKSDTKSLVVTVKPCIQSHEGAEKLGEAKAGHLKAKGARRLSVVKHNDRKHDAAVSA